MVRNNISDQANPRLREAILQVVQNQLRDGNPPETRKTYDRLLAEGIPKEETLKLIGYVVASEVFGVLKEERRYDEENYIKRLQALPVLPWDQEGL